MTPFFSFPLSASIDVRRTRFAQRTAARRAEHEKAPGQGEERACPAESRLATAERKRRQAARPVLPASIALDPQRLSAGYHQTQSGIDNLPPILCPRFLTPPSRPHGIDLPPFALGRADAAVHGHPVEQRVVEVESFAAEVQNLARLEAAGGSGDGMEDA